jgi:hypothetical protein
LWQRLVVYLLQQQAVSEFGISETWQTEIKIGYGDVESKVRILLPHTPDGDEITDRLVALN